MPIRDWDAHEYSLAHHGIKGQKWGVKNGPPYPLKDGGGSKTQGSATLAYLAINALLIVAPIAIRSIRRANQRNKIVKYTEDAHARKNSAKYASQREGEETDETGLLKKNKQMSIEQDMERVNPRGSEPNANPAFLTNCTACTVSMELRQRGYDVSAGTDSTQMLEMGGTNQLLRKSWYKTDYTIRGCNTTLQSLTESTTVKGKTTRGQVLNGWKTGGGHSMYYVNDNGKLTIYDTQTNKKLSDQQAKCTLNNSIYVAYARLDNAQFNYDNLRNQNIVD